MCSIVGSYDVATLKHLVDINAYRGQHFWSLLVFSNGVVEIDHGIGAFSDFESLAEAYQDADNPYFVLHHQEPTTLYPSKHPAHYGDSFLFHNGILKERFIGRMQGELNTDEGWDTLLLCQLIDEMGFECLEHVDGSFACVYVKDKDIYVFRNNLAPLYIDSNKSISSTTFGNELPLASECVMNLLTGEIVYSFKTSDDVYFYG